ncbi:MAG: hypothetical protein Q8R04_05435 [Nanoarchaeota archaeon]|nr:hypothetical protein [Nanoarchaeota archaeon]
MGTPIASSTTLDVVVGAPVTQYGKTRYHMTYGKTDSSSGVTTPRFKYPINAELAAAELYASLTKAKPPFRYTPPSIEGNPDDGYLIRFTLSVFRPSDIEEIMATLDNHRFFPE